MSTIAGLARRRRRPPADGLAEDQPIAAEAARHARRVPDITTITGVPGDIDRPAGSPSGACGRCGSKESRKQSRIQTGVYSDYPLCADVTACLERLGAAPALAPLPEPEAEGEPEPRGIPCGECGYRSPADSVWARWKDLQRHAKEHAPAGADAAEDDAAPGPDATEADDGSEACAAAEVGGE